jgi:hypothetical protein
MLAQKERAARWTPDGPGTEKGESAARSVPQLACNLHASEKFFISRVQHIIEAHSLTFESQQSKLASCFI